MRKEQEECCNVEEQEEGWMVSLIMLVFHNASRTDKFLSLAKLHIASKQRESIREGPTEGPGLNSAELQSLTYQHISNLRRFQVVAKPFQIREWSKRSIIAQALVWWMYFLLTMEAQRPLWVEAVRARKLRHAKLTSLFFWSPTIALIGREIASQEKRDSILRN